MNRKLILISCDNGGQGFLPGVSIDIQKYNDFFRSPIGGAWSDDEIRTYNNTTRDVLHDYIMMTEGARHVDYWLIVFCGHGRTDINRRTQMLLSQGNEFCELDIFTWVTNSRCLIICDCCRERRVLQGDQLIQEGLIREDRILNPDVCRDTYNNCLRLSPAGIHCCGYAASAHETAGEDNNIGGVYSFCLINAAKNLANHNGGIIEQQPYCLSFEAVHSNSVHNVEMLTQNEQHPVCCGNIGLLPFVVVA